MNFIPPNGFHIGPVPIHLYGLMLALAVLAAWFAALKLAPRFGLSSKQVDQAVFWLVISGFVGARLYFVLFELDYFIQNPVQIPAVWSGGLSIYGAVTGVVTGAVLFARKQGVDMWRMLDLLAVVAPLGQAIGRWGNFFNQEAFGRPTDLPWKIYIEPARRPPAFLDFQYFHPTFLYESLWNLMVLVVLLVLVRRTVRPGQLVGTYLILYPVGRFLIETLRTDSVIIGGVKADQAVSLLAVLLGTVILWKTQNRTHK